MRGTLWRYTAAGARVVERVVVRLVVFRAVVVDFFVVARFVVVFALRRVGALAFALVFAVEDRPFEDARAALAGRSVSARWPTTTGAPSSAPLTSAPH
jgi:hypothetical protein